MKFLTNSLMRLATGMAAPAMATAFRTVDQQKELEAQWKEKGSDTPHPHDFTEAELQQKRAAYGDAHVSLSNTHPTDLQHFEARAGVDTSVEFVHADNVGKSVPLVTLSADDMRTQPRVGLTVTRSNLKEVEQAVMNGEISQLDLVTQNKRGEIPAIMTLDEPPYQPTDTAIVEVVRDSDGKPVYNRMTWPTLVITPQDIGQPDVHTLQVPPVDAEAFHAGMKAVDSVGDLHQAIRSYDGTAIGVAQTAGDYHKPETIIYDTGFSETDYHGNTVDRDGKPQGTGVKVAAHGLSGTTVVLTHESPAMAAAITSRLRAGGVNVGSIGHIPAGGDHDGNTGFPKRLLEGGQRIGKSSRLLAASAALQMADSNAKASQADSNPRKGVNTPLRARYGLTQYDKNRLFTKDQQDHNEAVEQKRKERELRRLTEGGIYKPWSKKGKI